MKSSWTLNKILILAVVVIMVINLAVIATFLIRRNQSASSYALALTQPVMSVTGIVRQIEGKTVTVVYTSPVALDGVNKQHQFSVSVPENAPISKTAATIPYAFRQADTLPVSTMITISDIRAGDEVTVQSQTDLRTLSSAAFTAAAINVNPKSNIFSGVVQSTSGNAITVKGVRQQTSIVTGATAPKEEVMTISFTGTTEIVEMSGTPGVVSTAERKSQSDIRDSNIVTVYFEQGPSTGSATGLLVQIQPPLTMPDVPVQTSTPSAAATSPTAIPARSN